MLNRSLRLAVDGELKEVGAGVMSYRVEHPFSFRNEVEVQVSNCHAFSAGDGVAEVGAVGRDDGGIASSGEGLLHLGVVGEGLDLLFVKPAGGVDDEAAGLEGVVADGDFDLVRENLPDHGAGELGAVNLFAIGHQGVAGEGVVVLPASEGAHAADGGVDCFEA